MLYVADSSANSVRVVYLATKTVVTLVAAAGVRRLAKRRGGRRLRRRGGGRLCVPARLRCQRLGCVRWHLF